MTISEYRKVSTVRPPVEFVVKLKRLNDQLFPMFSPYTNCFDIFQFMGENEKPFMVYSCREDDGSFRQLDDRTIEHLKRCSINRKDELYAEIDTAEEKHNMSLLTIAKGIDNEARKLFAFGMGLRSFVPKSFNLLRG
ncbi:MAG: hypothetical protein WC616_01620 [Candidatus Omnitrophota bacterium]